MDVGPCMAVDVNNSCEFHTFELESTNASTQDQDQEEDLSVNKLANDVNNFLKIKDDSYEFQKKNEATEKAMKPVSAMKGSREKRGIIPPEKLTVKWAPDVYDPIPSSATHSVTNNKSQRHKSKKNSKSKQKKERGSKYKDKKHGRKRGGSSSNSTYKEEEEVVEYDDEALSASMDFHVGNPDQFCRGSFMKRYGNLHLSSVTEAT